MQLTTLRHGTFRAINTIFNAMRPPYCLSLTVKLPSFGQLMQHYGLVVVIVYPQCLLILYINLSVCV